MIYITGDTHGSYKRLRTFFRDKPVSKSDILIILGDTGLNYYGDERDAPHKNSAARLPLTLLCLRGNHDRNAATVPGYRWQRRFGDEVYFEPDYPDILFAPDRAIYRIEDKSFLAVGGAYSIDKQWRLSEGYNWFEDEQISPQAMAEVESRLDTEGWQTDIVLTHTCPLRFEPTEALFKSVDQSSVDKTMERWLDIIEARLSYRQWFCGHFHIDKQDGPLRFVFNDVISL